MIGFLGHPTYSAHLTTRGGGLVLADLGWETLRFSRALNDMSDAAVSVVAPDGGSLVGLVDAQPWEHELAIWADGDLAWAGPLRKPAYSSGDAAYGARDLFAWFERRSLSVDRAFDDIDLAKVFASLAEDALARDTSPAITIADQPCGIRGDIGVVGAERARAADVLRELGRTGVDWGCVGRTLFVGGALPGADLPPLLLLDDYVTGASWDRSGDSTATEVTLRWQDTEGMAATTTVTSIEARRFGLLELVEGEADITSAAVASAAASARLDILDTNPVGLSATLTAEAPVSLAELLPGRLVDCRLFDLPVPLEAILRLAKVSISASQTGDTVSVECIPAGAAAS